MTTLPTLAVAEAPIVPTGLLVPFGLLLLLIAVMPLTSERLKHWWEHYYPHVAIGLAVLVGGFYLLRMPGGGHQLGHILHEYFSFIALIGSLFVVAGGIVMNVRANAKPYENVAYLLFGAVLANLIGTTGASVMLIRPWIRMNRDRIRPYHIVFFIFAVSNVGGCLTPIGDPPLFLGYLRGVPFFWLIQHLWGEWLVALSLILAVFYGFDRYGYDRHPAPTREPQSNPQHKFSLEGRRNLGLLAVIVAGVFLSERYFVREMVILGAAAVSLWVTPKEIHARNRFSFGPIKEVAFLFIGIFVTMLPALNYLEARGSEFGFTQPRQYYVATGGLSAVLDNAPTYVNFLKLAETTFVDPSAAEVAEGEGSYDRRAVRLLLETHSPIVAAISLAAVFFGAMTYIGNGPNFMVKSIAESDGVACPTFFGYILKFSGPILLPILALVGWLFM